MPVHRFRIQVCSIVYLAQIGSFVPAERSHIGIVDAIFSRISSTQTVSRRTSTFFNDCAQVAAALLDTHERPLIVIDEFGKGTDEVDGMSLLTAVLQDFLSRDAVTVIPRCVSVQDTS
mmetsp:Transcript_6943/g.21118  ORF Transcript_6943/g.21118 Transcript_6943/m.21118 type:complete len:118 (-) Transcript_6943:18-371(-)